jgi:hypothetical protein
MSTTPSTASSDELLLQPGTKRKIETGIAKERVDTLSRLLSDLTMIHKMLVELRSKKNLDQNDFNQLIDLMPVRESLSGAEAKLETFFSKIETSFQPVTATILLVQDEECFNSSKGLPGRAKIMRNLKSFARTMQRIPLFIFNKILEVGGGKKRDYPVWEHTVYPGKAARYVLYSEHQHPETWIHSDRRYYRELVQIMEVMFRNLCESLEVTDIKISGKQQIAYRETIQTAIDALKTLRNKVRQALQKVESECRLFVDELADSIQNISRIAGTAEFPNRRYSDKRLFKLKEAAVTQLHSHYADWYKDYNALADRVVAVKSLYGFLMSLITSAGKLHQRIDALYTESIKARVEKINASYIVIHEEFDDKSIRGDRKSVQKAIGILNKKLNGEVIKPLEMLLSGLANKQDMFSGAEEFIRQIVDDSGKLPGEIDLIESIEEERIPPKTVTERIDLRRAIGAYIRSDIIRDIKPITSRIESYVSRINRELDELSSITDVNLTMAADVLDDSDDKNTSEEALKLIIESLDRIENRIKLTIGSIETENEECLRIVRSQTGEAVYYLRDLILKRELIRLKWKTRELEARTTAIGWKEELVSRSQSFFKSSAVAFRNTGKKVVFLWNKLRKLMGYKETVDVSIKTDVANYLAETERRIAELPLIYRKLYSFEPLQDKRYLTGRNNAISRFSKSWANWEKGLFSNTVYIGERGSGKTTMINMTKDIPDPAIERIVVGMNYTISDTSILLQDLCKALSLDSTGNTEDFILSVHQMPQRKIVILEGFQNLYLRNINGFDAIENFLLILSRTADKIFWVVTSSRYAWNYLDKVLRASEYFTDIIYCDRLSGHEIRELILNRHAMSGYDLKFEADAQVAQSRVYKKLGGNVELQQEYLSDRYFDDLSEIAEGNATIAIIYWLRSVGAADTSRIFISPLEEKRVQLSADLSEDALFTLAAILIHDDLTVGQLAQVLNISSARSRLLLSRMKSRSILTEREERYYLNNMLYRHATRIVTGKNILH